MIISKNIKIFLSTFFIVIVIITIIATIYTNKNEGKNESKIIIEGGNTQTISPINVPNEAISTTKGTSLEETYSTNGITYKYIESKKNNINIRYPVIDGLKNESIQESINSQILEKIYKVLDSNNFKNNSDNSAYAIASVVGNFSDILSVKLFVQFSEKFSKNYGVNFCLDTGEKIKIDDIFTYNTPKRNIIAQSAYKTFALEYYTNEGLSNDFYTKIDSDIFKFLQDFNKGKIAEFSITPMYIELYREGKTARIVMKDYAKYICIYKRFQSISNLYTSNEGIVEHIPVFMQRRETLFDLYEKVNDTCIIDVCIDKSNYEEKDFSEEEIKVIKNYKNDLVSKLEEFKTEKGLYYSNYVIVSRSQENGKDILIFSEEEKYLKTNDENFEKYYIKILNAERDLYNENHIESMINVIDKEEIAENRFEVKYSMETGEEIIEEEPTDEEDDEEVGDNEDDTEQTPISTPEASDLPTSEPSVSPSQMPTQQPLQTSTPTPTFDNITTQVYF